MRHHNVIEMESLENKSVFKIACRCVRFGINEPGFLF